MKNTLKTIISTVLCYLMVLSVVPMGAFTASAAITGSGTQTSPYLVSTAADFENALSLYNEEGVYIRLRANITLGSTYTPGSFKAVLDGDFYKITSPINLFYSNSGTIKNLYFECSTSDLAFSSTYGGLICERNSGTISGVIAKGSINCSCSHGISGDNGSSEATNVGFISGSSSGTIINCAGIGSVKTYCPYGSRAGGITSSGTAINSYVAGTVTASGSSRYGTSKSHPITLGTSDNCYYNSTLLSSTVSGGFTTSEMKTQSFVDKLNASTNSTDSVWIRDTSSKNSGYPILKRSLDAQITSSKENILLSGTEKIYLTCSDPDAKIYYNKSSTIPTTSSTLYTSSGISISSTTTITAIAYKDGLYSMPYRFNYAAVSGNGTAGSPYQINSEAALNAIAELGTSAYYKLTRNITLVGEMPCFDVFSGSFDGQDYSINNVYTTELKSGLFKENYGIIKNLKINISAEKDYNACGGIVRSNYGVVYNCSVNGNMNVGEIAYSSYGFSSRMGGIAAENEGRIEKCSMTGNINVRQSDYTGGVVGLNKGIVEYSSFNGKIDVYSTTFNGHQGYVGGLVGGNASGAVIRYCDVVSTSIVGGCRNYSGVIVGELYGYNSGSVIDCTTSVSFIDWESNYCEFGTCAIVHGTGTTTGEARPDVHTHDYKATVVEPTCTVGRLYNFSCSCGNVSSYEVPYTELDHDFSDYIYTQAIAPTCTEKGESRCYCSRCDYYLTKEIAATGHSYTSAVTKEASCSETGIRTYTCSSCGYSYENTISKKSHTYTKTVVAPTCEEQGYTVYTCSVCSYTYNSGYVNATGHNMGEWEFIVEPDCTNGGSRKRVCLTDSTHVETEELDALGHDEIAHSAKAPTCTQIGWGSYVTCSRCDYTTYEEIPALGHDMHTFGAKEPTCEEVGCDSYSACSRCDYIVYVGEIPELGHDKIVNPAVAPDCENIGWDEYISCSRCDFTTYEEIPALGHDEISHSAQRVTCEEIGWNDYVTCSRCDYTTYEEIAALGHTVSVWTITKAPTCTEDGLYTAACSRLYTEAVEGPYPESAHPYRSNLNEVYEISVPGATKLRITFSADTELENSYDKLYFYNKNGGQIGDYYTGEALSGKTVTVYADYVKINFTTDGSVEKYGFKITNIEADYNSCGATIEKVVPATGHTEVTHEAQAPDCENIGWNAYITCSKCSYTTYEEIAALGHDEVVHEAKPVTCLDIGWNEYVTCTRCDYTTYEEIPAKGHSLYRVEEKFATCEEIGWELHARCNDCDFSGFEEIPALGHLENEWQTVTAPTCTKVGLEKKICGRTIYAESTAEGSYPESTHNYGSNLEKDYTFSVAKADELVLTFSSDTEFETNYDILYIYDGDDNLIASYTGKKLASKEVVVPGNFVRLHLSTDSSVTKYGFRITSIKIRDTLFACDKVEEREIPATGHALVFVEAKAPTCGEIGWNDYNYCENCDYTEMVEIPAINHGNKYTVDAIAPTCTEAGYSEGVYCPDCEAFVEGHEELAATNHISKYIVEELAATCTTAGYTAGIFCPDCDAFIEGHEEIAAINHTGKYVVESIAATCTAVGYTEGIFCPDCDMFLEGHEEIAIDAEAHGWNSGEITTTATCKVSGIKTYTCQHNASHKKTENLGLDSANHVNTTTVAEIEATCTTVGYTAGVYCEDCAKYISGHEEIPATNHPAKYTVEELAATCTAKGYTEGIFCPDCDAFIEGHEEIAIDAEAHKWNSGEITTVATCITEGIKIYTCQHNEEHKRTENLGLDSTNHINTIDVAEIEATCTAVGYTEGVYCEDCAKYISGHEEIPATNHPEKYTVEAIAATCMAVGYTEGIFCPDCVAFIEGHEEIAIDAEAHKWDDGEITTVATCITEGIKIYTCQHNEEHKRTENFGLDSANHVNTTTVAEIEETCTTVGYTAGVYCDDCAKYILGHTEISATNHPAKYTVEELAATCTTAGYTAGIFCPDCVAFIEGHEEIAIDAEAHKWDDGKITAVATCITEGIKIYTCQHNAAHKKTENLGLDSANHVNTTTVAEIEATCTAVGYTAGVYCEDCAKYISGHEEIPATNHPAKYTVEAIAATCTTAGYTAGVYCDDCAKYVSGHAEIAIDAEAHKWNNGEITAVATCKVSGIRTYTCQHNAAHKKTENLGVNSGKHVRTRAVAAIGATCTSKGYTAGVYCDDCAKYISGHAEIAINADSHKWNNGEITAVATCKVSGIKTYTCQHNAAHKKTENLGVNSGNHVRTRAVAAIGATCTSKGYTAGVYCDDCAKYISGHAEIAINPYAHKNTTKVPAVAATIQSVGYTEGVFCNDCKKYVSGHAEIPKLTPAFTDSSEAKVSGNDIVADNGIKAEKLLTQASTGSVIKKLTGEVLGSGEAVGTGMTLIFADGTKKEIVVSGDADGDAKITSADARFALRAAVGLDECDEKTAFYKAANVDIADKLSASDARLILRASVGLEDPKKWAK